EVRGNITAGGSLQILADDNITIGNWFWGRGNVQANDNIGLFANEDGDGYGDVEVYGDIDAGGNVKIDAADDTIYLWGDVTAGGDVWFKANVEFEGWNDQFVNAGGMIRADGYLNKLNTLFFGLFKSSGSLYLLADGDIRLDDYVRAADWYPRCCGSYGGGVAIISGGSIYTDSIENGLNVPIIGRSDHYEGVGVYNLALGDEDNDARMAIWIQSSEDLKLGDESQLRAFGKYYDDGSVDDRYAIGFVDTAGTRIPSPDGPVRNEGDPFDLAIYVASTDGDVHVGASTSILSTEYIETQEVSKGDCMFIPKGAMVIDALTNVTFGQPFIDSLKMGEVGTRLEVASRITEWLEDAIGRLPYADLWINPRTGPNPPFPAGYNYVLRGAGGFGEGAWVLENPDDPPPLTQEAGAASEDQVFGPGGCPALMQWFAQEIGVAEEDIQVFVADTFAMSTDIQPCDSCARLKNAADTLDDAEGARIAALAQVINEFVTPAAPPTPEQMTLIAQAFSDHVGDGTYYASAGEYMDALVEYVGIMNSEMGFSEDQATAYLTTNHAPTTSDAAVTAYIEARLAALGG
ncbi:MAG: hypothetical protein ACYTBP_14555, partial [Planctomycetota bacterium]